MRINYSRPLIYLRSDKVFPTVRSHDLLKGLIEPELS